MSSAEWEKCSFISFLDCVRSSATECLGCLFVLLRGPESTLAENSWQWHIRRGFFKVTALFWLGALHAFHSFPLKYLCTNDREDGWPLTSGATEGSSCLSAPSVNQHITTNPDTTWWNVTHTVTSQQPQQPWLMKQLFPKQTKNVLASS